MSNHEDYERIPRVFKSFISSSPHMEAISLSTKPEKQDSINNYIKKNRKGSVFKQQLGSISKVMHFLLQILPFRINARKLTRDLTSSIDLSLFLPAFNT